MHKTGLAAAREHLKYNLTDTAAKTQPAIHNLSQALYLVVDSLERIERRLAQLESLPAKGAK